MDNKQPEFQPLQSSEKTFPVKHSFQLLVTPKQSPWQLLLELLGMILPVLTHWLNQTEGNLSSLNFTLAMDRVGPSTDAAPVNSSEVSTNLPLNGCLEKCRNQQKQEFVQDLPRSNPLLTNTQQKDSRSLYLRNLKLGVQSLL